MTHLEEACINFQKLTAANEGLDAAAYLWRRTGLAQYFALSQRRFPDLLKLYFWARKTLSLTQLKGICRDNAPTAPKRAPYCDRPSVKKWKK